MQNALGYVAHLAEGVKNTFNFSVPFLSYLAIVVLLAIGVVLYYINLRYLLIIWGINKFSKKLIRPNYVPNNELLDFLSRVPDDEELIDYREMKLENESSSSAHASPTKKNQNVAHHQHHAEGGKKKKKSWKSLKFLLNSSSFVFMRRCTQAFFAQISSEFQKIKNLYPLFMIIRFFQNHIQSILQIWLWFSVEFNRKNMPKKLLSKKILSSMSVILKSLCLSFSCQSIIIFYIKTIMSSMHHNHSNTFSIDLNFVQSFFITWRQIIFCWNHSHKIFL